MVDNGGAGTGQGAGANTQGGAGGGQGSATGSYTVPAAGTAAAGAQGGAGAAVGAGGESARERREQGASTIVERLLHRYGSAERALEVLAGDNFDLRETNRTVTQQLANLPPAGALVLVGPDVAEYNGFKALNLPPDKVKERLTEHDRLLQESQRTQVHTLAEQSANALGWNPAAVGEFITDKALQLDMRDTVVTENGKAVAKKMPFVRKASDTNGQYVPLADYAQAHHAAYLPALTAKPAAQGATGAAATGAAASTGTGSGTQQTTQGAGAQGAQGNVVVFGAQADGASGGQGAALNPVDALIERNKQAAAGSNALRPKAAT